MQGVTVLLATCNGARHLSAQLDSIAAQRGVDWALWASDDGSGDDTVAILRRFREAHPARDIRIIAGPCRGVAANFLGLLAHPDLPVGAVALADQDDVWMPDRLHRALGMLARHDGPALYASATIVVDENLASPRLSRPKPPPVHFGNALVQNVVAGNTMVMNAEALALVRRTMPATDVPYQDWWLYALMSGAEAAIRIDPQPGLYYRQHMSNALGASSGAAAFRARLRRAMRGEYSIWLRQNAVALHAAQAALTPDAGAKVAVFMSDLGRGGVGRLWRMRRMGLRRETMFGTAMLYLAAFLGRI